LCTFVQKGAVPTPFSYFRKLGFWSALLFFINFNTTKLSLVAPIGRKEVEPLLAMHARHHDQRANISDTTYHSKNVNAVPIFTEISRTKSDYEQLMKARRMATRRRAEAACLPCKTKKTRCGNSRPCSRCSQIPGEICVDKLPIQIENRHIDGPTSDSRVSTVAPTFLQRNINKGLSFNSLPDHVSLPGNVDARTSSNQYVLAYHHISMPWTGQDNAVSNEWVWEAAAGPGKDDPFRNDWMLGHTTAKGNSSTSGQ
jgi:hypothetical protein